MTEDSYVHQLHQVFRSCDTRGDGLLGRDEVVQLCHKLQLTEQQSWYISDRLIGTDILIKIDFDEFKEAFVDLLTQEVEEVGEERVGDVTICEATSLADRKKVIDRNNCSSHDEESDEELIVVLPNNESNECREQEIRPVNNTSSSFKSENGHQHQKQQQRHQCEHHEIANNSADNDLTSVEEYLRSIWAHLNVGQDGYLNSEELYSVCVGIGMTDMSDEMVNQLFITLDEDGDGRVSFDELLQGMFRSQQESQQQPLNDDHNKQQQPKTTQQTQQQNGTQNNDGDDGNTPEKRPKNNNRSVGNEESSYIIPSSPARSVIPGNSHASKQHISRRQEFRQHEVLSSSPLSPSLLHSPLSSPSHSNQYQSHPRHSMPYHLNHLHSHQRRNSQHIFPHRSSLPPEAHIDRVMENILSNSFYLFSLDINGTGTVDTDLVISLWESFGFSNARRLLKEMGFQNSGLLNLQRLSSMLEEELTNFASLSPPSSSSSSSTPSTSSLTSTTTTSTSGNSYATRQSTSSSSTSKNLHSSSTNPSATHLEKTSQRDLVKRQVSQVALLSLLNEFLFLKTNFSQLKDERDRLRVNVTEANLRADLLAQEVDDHHHQLEQSSHNKIAALEKKYQDQVRCLEEDLIRERESMASKWVQLKNDFERDKATLVNHEIELRRQLEHMEKENKRLEMEVQELSSRVVEVEKCNGLLQSKLQQEQDVFKQKIEDAESMQILLNEQQYKSLVMELEAAKRQTKECQDLNDELVLQVEKLKQQIEQNSRVREKGYWKRLKDGSLKSSSSSSTSNASSPSVSLTCDVPQTLSQSQSLPLPYNPTTSSAITASGSSSTSISTITKTGREGATTTATEAAENEILKADGVGGGSTGDQRCEGGRHASNTQVEDCTSTIPPLVTTSCSTVSLPSCHSMAEINERGNFCTSLDSTSFLDGESLNKGRSRRNHSLDFIGTEVCCHSVCDGMEVEEYTRNSPSPSTSMTQRNKQNAESSTESTISSSSGKKKKQHANSVGDDEKQGESCTKNLIRDDKGEVKDDQQPFQSSTHKHLGYFYPQGQEVGTDSDRGEGDPSSIVPQVLTSAAVFPSEFLQGNCDPTSSIEAKIDDNKNQVMSVKDKTSLESSKGRTTAATTSGTTTTKGNSSRARRARRRRLREMAEETGQRDDKENKQHDVRNAAVSTGKDVHKRHTKA